jgi:predicted nucleic acid-binding protein
VIFVDTNVLSDFFANDPEWGLAARNALRDAFLQGSVVTSHIVLAELFAKKDASPAFASGLEAIGLQLVDLDQAAAWLAGQAHGLYRQRGGERSAILADFLIGGQAQALGATILTRDKSRFVSYFPELSIITPETHP